MAGENILPYKVAAHRHTPEIEEQLALLDPRLCDLRVQFQAHLVPLDEGELASCYVTTDARCECLGARGPLRRRLCRSSPSSRSSACRPGTRDVFATNFCRVFAAADAHTGKIVVLSAIDNLWKGTSSQARPEPQRDVRVPRDRGASVSAARILLRLALGERAPGRARAAPRRWAARRLPRGGSRVRDQAERAPRPRPALLRCPSGPSSAALLHREQRAGRARPAHARSLRASARCAALVVNSGCANAATGERGLADATRVQEAGARALGVEPAQTALASTGSISHHLPLERVLAGIEQATPELRARGRRRLPARDRNDRLLREAGDARGGARRRARCGCARSARARA